MTYKQTIKAALPWFKLMVEGKVIEHRTKENKWVNVESIEFCLSDMAYASGEGRLRVKPPEPVRCWALRYNVSSSKTIFFETRQAAWDHMQGHPGSFILPMVQEDEVKPKDLTVKIIKRGDEYALQFFDVSGKEFSMLWANTTAIRAFITNLTNVAPVTQLEDSKDEENDGWSNIKH